MLTDDVANRQFCEKEGLSCTSGELGTSSTSLFKLKIFKVRKYVEGGEEAQFLLDLLSAAGESDLGTNAALVTGRGALYPEVSYNI